VKPFLVLKEKECSGLFRAAVAVVGKGRKGKYKGLEGPLWKTQKIGV